MEEIIVISDGSEISFAKPFVDLFRTQTDKETFTSTKGRTIQPELYSKQVYLSSSAPKKAFRLIIGSATMETPQMRLVYSDTGMKCYLGNQFAKIIVDTTKASANYDSIFLKLEKIENEYFEAEAEYVKKCGMKRSTYISPGKSFFSKNWMNDRIVQAYLCLAYHFYFHEVDEYIKRID